MGSADALRCHLQGIGYCAHAQHAHAFFWWIGKNICASWLLHLLRHKPPSAQSFALKIAVDYRSPAALTDDPGATDSVAYSEPPSILALMARPPPHRHRFSRLPTMYAATETELQRHLPIYLERTPTTVYPLFDITHYSRTETPTTQTHTPYIYVITQVHGSLAGCLVTRSRGWKLRTTCGDGKRD